MEAHLRTKSRWGYVYYIHRLSLKLTIVPVELCFELSRLGALPQCTAARYTLVFITASLRGRDKDSDSVLSSLTRLPLCIIVKLKGCRSTDVE